MNNRRRIKWRSRSTASVLQHVLATADQIHHFQIEKGSCDVCLFGINLQRTWMTVSCEEYQGNWTHIALLLCTLSDCSNMLFYKIFKSFSCLICQCQLVTICSWIELC